jgi:actin-related protein
MSSKTVVIELGSSLFRIGYAGNHFPLYVIPVIQFEDYFIRTYGCKGYTDIIDEVEARKSLTIIFTRLFVDFLQVKPKDHRVLLVENFYVPRAIRDGAITSLLKDLQVQSVTMQPNLPLAILPSGKDYGLMIDIGEKESSAVVVAHGRVLLTTYTQTPIGVSFSAKTFAHMMKTNLGIEMDLQRSRELFEKVVLATHTSSHPQGVRFTQNEDSSSDDIEVPGRLRCAPVHVLVGLEEYDDIVHDNDDDYIENDDELGGLAGLLLECLKKCSHDVRALVLHNVVFCGGGSMIPGVPMRTCIIASSRAARMPKYHEVHQAVSHLPSGTLNPTQLPFPPSSLAWIGGSIFASLKNNDAKFITLKDLYDRAISSGAFQPPEGSLDTQGGAAESSQNVWSGPSNTIPLSNKQVLPAPDWLSLDTTERIFFGQT